MSSWSDAEININVNIFTRWYLSRGNSSERRHVWIEKIPLGGRDGGGSENLFFTVINVFLEGCTYLTREAIGPGSNYFSRGVCISISKENIVTHCDFPEGPLSPSGSANGSIL